MFRRRRDHEPAEPAESIDIPEPSEPVAVEPIEPEGAETGGWVPPAAPTPGPGPFDEALAPDDELPRLDLGGMRVPVFEGGELRVEVDEESGAVVGATVVTGDSALQLHPFAAPRSAGIWDEVRREIGASIEASGGRVAEAVGAFGTELHASVPTQLADGSVVPTPARFIGVDGPRWFLRGVLTGPAAEDADAAAPLETAFRRVVVVRGNDPMAPRDPIPLHLPPEIAGAAADAQPPVEGEPDFDPFERGPEITEVR